MKALYLRNACCCVAQTRSGIDMTYRMLEKSSQKHMSYLAPKKMSSAYGPCTSMWVSCPTRVVVMPCAAKCRRIALLAKQCSH